MLSDRTIKKGFGLVADGVKAGLTDLLEMLL